MSSRGHTRLTEARDRFLTANKVRLSKSTVDAYRLTIDSLIQHSGDLYCENVSPDHIEAFLAGLMEPHKCLRGLNRPPISATSYNGYRARLSVFCKWLLD